MKRFKKLMGGLMTAFAICFLFANVLNVQANTYEDKAKDATIKLDGETDTESVRTSLNRYGKTTGKLRIVKVTKSSVSFAPEYEYATVREFSWRKKGEETWQTQKTLEPKVTGLKANTTYEFKCVEFWNSVPLFESNPITVTTANSKAPAISSIKISKSRNATYGYRDILGRWHTTGTAAIGTITVTFKTAPSAKYAVIYHSGGSRCVKIKGKKAVLKNTQFQRGSKKGGTTKVWVATASALDQNTRETGLSKKTKKKSVKIK